jgi:hypothetical protein
MVVNTSKKRRFRVLSRKQLSRYSLYSLRFLKYKLEETQNIQY